MTASIRWVLSIRHITRRNFPLLIQAETTRAVVGNAEVYIVICVGRWRPILTSTLRMKAVHSPETLVPIYQTIWLLNGSVSIDTIWCHKRIIIWIFTALKTSDPNLMYKSLIPVQLTSMDFLRKDRIFSRPSQFHYMCRPLSRPGTCKLMRLSL
jgi:hypothetical protein